MMEMNVAELLALADDILDESKKYLDGVGEIQAEVAVLGQHWTGEAYNAFKSTFQVKYNRCQQLYNELVSIVNSVNDTASLGEKLEAKVLDIMDNL